ncbi:MAG: SpoIIIAH-like family protein [Oscillospiraceae bacterium]|nr:SpoIIIAH-like family protein [Oscillospiraceae bacterium]
MKIWKRNAIVAAVLVFVCGGIYLNWRYESQKPADLVSTLDQQKLMDDAALVMQKETDSLEALANQPSEAEDAPAAEVFAKMRLSRQQNRDSAVHLLQETISYAGENEDVSASTLKLESIVNMALSEASIESLVISKGYSECVAYMTGEGIDLAVASDGLSETDVAILTDIVLAQTDYDLSQIRIIEVKT